MIAYARLDTHYLLALYDYMRIELLSSPIGSTEDTSLLTAVLAEGKSLCMRVYTKKEICDSFMQDTNFRYSTLVFSFGVTALGMDTRPSPPTVR